MDRFKEVTYKGLVYVSGRSVHQCPINEVGSSNERALYHAGHTRNAAGGAVSAGKPQLVICGAYHIGVGNRI